MSVRVRLFAAYREALGSDVLEVPAEDGLTVGQIWQRLLERQPALANQRPSAAVNAAFAEADTPVNEGDEVAFLPPVSGG